MDQGPQKEIKTGFETPGWHYDITPGAMLTWCGNWFEFVGVDPDRPDIVFFRHVNETKNNTRTKGKK